MFIVNSIFNSLSSLFYKRKETPDLLPNCIVTLGLKNAIHFSFENQKEKTLKFVSQMQTSNEFEYKYSPSNKVPSIYNSVYACMILSMYGEIKKMDTLTKKKWISYFDSFQDPNTGFFVDDRIVNKNWKTINWWGAKHLCPQVISVYTAFGAKPKHEFIWVKKYYDINLLQSLLDTCDWDSAIPDENDIDNEIMNLGAILQYQRDFFNDQQAGKAVVFLKDYLKSKINASTGMWGGYNVNDKAELARMIQFSYHLFRIFFYDNEALINEKKLIDLILKSQSSNGGWGMKINSSACEDIDAIDILIYASNRTDYRKEDIKKAITLSLIFILANQNEDGGFVFRRDEPFTYGTSVMSSGRNESAMFPTWFRSLCIAYMCNFLGIANYDIVHCPGY